MSMLVKSPHRKQAPRRGGGRGGGGTMSRLHLKRINKVRIMGVI